MMGWLVDCVDVLTLYIGEVDGTRARRRLIPLLRNILCMYECAF